MAYARIPAPGTTFGPCADGCQHRDCAASRASALKVCHHCKQPIGFETPYFAENDVGSGLVHAECEYESIERELGRIDRHGEV